eukprot:TRINITY_DN13782_c0_g2_i1.p1 TRINITY_DN13782_c0_g2~~TRINITY_DN13782_c0_g2_i1.p1  ORF type:complete len:549 (-),score=123.06 TRINITY_DN13782_c0_g2_i1:219-1649(-)
MALSQPPLNKLYEVPRAVALKELVQNINKLKGIDRKQLKKLHKEYKGMGCHIKVKIVRARGLMRVSNVFPDPYCEVQVGLLEQKTKAKTKTVNPEWNEIITFAAMGVDPLVHHIKISIKDKNKHYSRDQHNLGQVEIPFCEVSSKMNQELWFPVESETRTAQASGEICVVFRVSGRGKDVCKACELFLGDMDTVCYGNEKFHACCVKCHECATPLAPLLGSLALVTPPTPKRNTDQQQHHQDLHVPKVATVSDDVVVIETVTTDLNQNSQPSRPISIVDSSTTVEAVTSVSTTFMTTSTSTSMPISIPIGTPTGTPTGTPASTPTGPPTSTPTGTPTTTTNVATNTTTSILPNIITTRPPSMSTTSKNVSNTSSTTPPLESSPRIPTSSSTPQTFGKRTITRTMSNLGNGEEIKFYRVDQPVGKRVYFMCVKHFVTSGLDASAAVNEIPHLETGILSQPPKIKIPLTARKGNNKQD